MKPGDRITIAGCFAIIARLLAFMLAVTRAVPRYLRHHWQLSRAYDALMRRWRGWGGFTGQDRKGYSFGHFVRLCWRAPR